MGSNFVIARTFVFVSILVTGFAWTSGSANGQNSAYNPYGQNAANARYQQQAVSQFKRDMAIAYAAQRQQQQASNVYNPNLARPMAKAGYNAYGVMPAGNFASAPQDPHYAFQSQRTSQRLADEYAIAKQREVMAQVRVAARQQEFQSSFPPKLPGVPVGFRRRYQDDPFGEKQGNGSISQDSSPFGETQDITPQNPPQNPFGETPQDPPQNPFGETPQNAPQNPFGNQTPSENPFGGMQDTIQDPPQNPFGNQDPPPSNPFGIQDPPNNTVEPFADPPGDIERPDMTPRQQENPFGEDQTRQRGSSEIELPNRDPVTSPREQEDEVPPGMVTPESAERGLGRGIDPIPGNGMGRIEQVPRGTPMTGGNLLTDPRMVSPPAQPIYPQVYPRDPFPRSYPTNPLPNYGTAPSMAPRAAPGYGMAPRMAPSMAPRMAPGMAPGMAPNGLPPIYQAPATTHVAPHAMSAVPTNAPVDSSVYQGVVGEAAGCGSECGNGYSMGCGCPNFYFSVFGGSNSLDSVFDQGAGTFMADDGGLVGVALGQRHGRNLRSELEYTYRSNEITSFQPSGLGLVNLSGGLRTHSGMANAYWEFVQFPHKCFKPYVGAGLGFATFDGRDVLLPTGQSILASGDRESSFAYQFMIGANYKAYRNMDLFLEYRLFKTDAFRVDTASGIGSGDYEYEADSIVAGLRWKF